MFVVTLRVCQQFKHQNRTSKLKSAAIGLIMVAKMIKCEPSGS